MERAEQVFGVWLEKIKWKAFHHTRLPANVFICDIFEFWKKKKLNKDMEKKVISFILLRSWETCALM